jgi:hypothetical protein
MLGDFPNWLQVFLAAIAGGIGAYAAIRADLAGLKVQAAIFEKSLERAHDRIDDLHAHRGN